jgi:hypothetical protein
MTRIHRGRVKGDQALLGADNSFAEGRLEITKGSGHIRRYAGLSLKPPVESSVLISEYGVNSYSGEILAYKWAVEPDDRVTRVRIIRSEHEGEAVHAKKAVRSGLL